jgi:hypothetical protein
MTTFIQNRLDKLLGKNSRFRVKTVEYQQEQGQQIEVKQPEQIQASTFRKFDPKKLTVKEESLTFFALIYGYDKIKFVVYLALTSQGQKNTLLHGPPASAKSLFMKIIEEQCEDVIYFDASNSSGAGLIETLYLNQTKKILLIDEAGMLDKNGLDALRGLLNDGRIVKTLKKKRYDFTMKDVKIFGTTNDLNMPKPILSRFMIYQLPAYTDTEFIEVSKHCLKDRIPADTAEILAQVLLKYNMKDIRKLMYVSGLIRKEFTLEDVIEVVETIIEYQPSLTKESDYN